MNCKFKCMWLDDGCLQNNKKHILINNQKTALIKRQGIIPRIFYLATVFFFPSFTKLLKYTGSTKGFPNLKHICKCNNGTMLFKTQAHFSKTGASAH